MSCSSNSRTPPGPKTSTRRGTTWSRAAKCINSNRAWTRSNGPEGSGSVTTSASTTSIVCESRSRRNRVSMSTATTCPCGPGLGSHPPRHRAAPRPHLEAAPARLQPGGAQPAPGDRVVRQLESLEATIRQLPRIRQGVPVRRHQPPPDDSRRDDAAQMPEPCDLAPPAVRGRNHTTIVTIAPGQRHPPGEGRPPLQTSGCLDGTDQPHHLGPVSIRRFGASPAPLEGQSTTRLGSSASASLAAASTAARESGPCGARPTLRDGLSRRPQLWHPSDAHPAHVRAVQRAR